MLSGADGNFRNEKEKKKKAYLRSFIAQPSTATIFPASLLPPMADIPSSFYGGPGQKYRGYSAFGQITGLFPCKLQAPLGTRLAGQLVLGGAIAIFIVGLSVYALS